MKKFSFLVSAVFVIGCAAQLDVNAPGSAHECETGNAERDKECYRELARVAREQILKNVKRTQVPTPETQSPDPRSGVLLQGTPVEMRRVVFPKTAKGGCISGYNFAIVNHTNLYLEVVGRTLIPCGESYLVDQYVEQGNSGKRLAKLIPPYKVGAYYFDPDAGGDGPQDYTVVGYSPSHIHGSAEFPRKATGGTYTNRVRTPFEDPWWQVPIHPRDVGQI